MADEEGAVVLEVVRNRSRIEIRRADELSIEVEAHSSDHVTIHGDRDVMPLEIGERGYRVREELVRVPVIPVQQQVKPIIGESEGVAHPGAGDLSLEDEAGVERESG